MNEKIKQLAIRAGLTCTQDGWVSTQKKHAEGVEDEYLEHFAALVRDDALEEAARAMQPMLRDMISRGNAADIIRQLKDRP
jgi:hypothetical protein